MSSRQEQAGTGDSRQMRHRLIAGRKYQRITEKQYKHVVVNEKGVIALKSSH